ncbi:hypothetical membrane protein [Rhodococcus opacus B4]|uniref:Hypothetical membrane protein n=1 Tax=Rhodococcus opacus (strain B4) TaxID=632772 RepID=C1AWL3_RHOOB|nr:hypothetical membrane protein [Rhodococcus opacus B4]
MSSVVPESAVSPDERLVALVESSDVPVSSVVLESYEVVESYELVVSVVAAVPVSVVAVSWLRPVSAAMSVRVLIAELWSVDVGSLLAVVVVDGVACDWPRSAVGAVAVVAAAVCVAVLSSAVLWVVLFSVVPVEVGVVCDPPRSAVGAVAFCVVAADVAPAAVAVVCEACAASSPEAVAASGLRVFCCVVEVSEVAVVLVCRIVVSRGCDVAAASEWVDTGVAVIGWAADVAVAGAVFAAGVAAAGCMAEAVGEDTDAVWLSVVGCVATGLPWLNEG